MPHREIHRAGMIAETLKSGSAGHSVEKYRHSKVRGTAQSQHWRPIGYKKLTHGLLFSARVELISSQ